MTLSPSTLKAVHGLALDAAARDVVEAFQAAGVRPLLIKGPAITRWLYADSAARSYLDIDLLVSPDDWEAATRVLAQLGFESRNAGLSRRELEKLAKERQVARHAETFRGPQGINIDLHRTIVGIGVSGAEVWEAFFEDREPLVVGNRPVDVPAEPARALIVVLEAAKAGRGEEKGIGDLQRALVVLHETTWHAAAGLARRLGAEAAFATGLRLLPAGEALAGRLGVSPEIDVETALRALAAPPTAFGFQRLAETKGMRAKGGLFVAELVPSRPFMRSRFAIARHGSLGLLLAYLWRPFSLLIHTGEGLRALRRARKEAG